MSRIKDKNQSVSVGEVVALLSQMRTGIETGNLANSVYDDLLKPIVDEVNALVQVSQVQAQTERENSQVINLLGIGVWKWDLVSNALEWDDNMYRLYGVERKDFSGAYEAWERSLSSETKESAVNEINAAIAGVKDFDTTFQVVHKSGKVQEIRTRAIVIRDENGKPLKMHGINFDRTREAKLERERIKAEERFRIAVEAAPNGMVMINSTGNIVLVNKQSEDMFGYSRSELVGQPIELLVPEEFKDRHPGFIETYVLNPEPRSMGMGRELFGRRKDGSKIPVEIGLRPIFTDDGVFVISSIVDVTERQKAAALLREKNEELEQFAYRTSHDLRSPLLSVGQLSDCIEEDIRDKNYDEAIANVVKVKSITSRLRSLIEDILTLTKSDFVNESFSAFDFEAALAAAKEKFGPEISEAGIEIRCQLSHDRPLLTQTIRLSQVLDNFISNAIKYRDAAKPTRFVAVKTYNDADYFYLQIQDNGVGIPKERQGEVFGMFKRFHDKSTVGSGLGLYIVRKHLAKLGADVRFDSSGAGTTFYLKFHLAHS